MRSLPLALAAGLTVLSLATPPLATAQSSLGSSKPGSTLPTSGTTAGKEARFEEETIRLLNEHRASHHLNPVVIDPTLTAQAKNWSEYMSRTGDFQHGKWNVFENIAYNHRLDDASALFHQWKNSPGHNRNMLEPTVTKVGVGVQITSNNRVYGTMQLIW